MIKGVHDSCELLIGYPSEVLVFREELTDQAIRIFVHPPFPGCIRMRKVDPGIEILSHPSMITKFPAIVIGNRLHASLVWPESTSDRRADRNGGLLWHPLQHRILGVVFHQGH